MSIDSETLWGALYDIGNDENVRQIPPAVIAKLSELGLVEIAPSGPVLTPRGERAFVVLESGDGEIAELDNVR